MREAVFQIAVIVLIRLRVNDDRMIDAGFPGRTADRAREAQEAPDTRRSRGRGIASDRTDRM